MAVSNTAAMLVMRSTLFTCDGANSSRNALAAGMVPDTMNRHDATSSAQPAKNPAVLPKIFPTHAKEAPAFGSILLRWMKAKVMPNMIRPQYSRLATESTPTAAMMVVAVTSTLNAGAVPAMPMMIDSQTPIDPAFSLCSCAMVVRWSWSRMVSRRDAGRSPFSGSRDYPRNRPASDVPARQHLHREQPEDEPDAAVDDALQQPVGAPLLDEQRLDRALLGRGARLQGRVQEARQLGQQLHIAWRLVLHPLQQAAPANLVVHPALQERLGGVPQVQVGVELAPEPFDIEQRLLQQHELRLDLDVEAARGLEQPQQHLAERDVLQRPVEVRLADRADRAFELVDTRRRRHPAAFDVQLGDALVVAPEEGDEVLRQVFLVELGERADDAEIERDVAPEGRRREP